MLVLNQIMKICIIGLLLSGCSGMFAPLETPEVQNYQIVAGSDDVKTVGCASVGHQQTLQIARMRAEAPYETTKMFYSKGKYQLDSYSYNQWAAFPTQMLSNEVFQKITQACIYKSVVSGEFMTASDYTLNTKLSEIKQTINGVNSEVSLIILAQIVNNRPDNVIRSKTFVIKVKSEANPKAYVASVNQATNEFLSQLVAWLR
jgi:cholesterol transport system auxiliary component